MLKTFTEGKAKFHASSGLLSSKMEVFYNPAMKLNRDISIWLISKLKPKKICCAMAASGIRAIRLALEADAKNILTNDANKKAVKAMQKNISMNRVEDRIRITNKHVQDLLKEETYDYIDIDPFGCPVPYIEDAISALKPKGILALTATDNSCLCGRYVKACEKKYSARPLKCGFEKEIGLRILISKTQSIVASKNKSLVPILSHSSNHYSRVYLVHSPKKTKDNTGYILYCPKCLKRKTSKNKKSKCCNKQMLYAGPLWLGSLWDKDLVKSFTLIPYIREESRIKTISFYDTHKFAKVYRKTAPRVDKLIEKLKQNGFLASRTHFKPEGIRTNADIKKFISFF